MIDTANLLDIKFTEETDRGRETGQGEHEQRQHRRQVGVGFAYTGQLHEVGFTAGSGFQDGYHGESAQVEEGISHQVKDSR